MSPSRDHAGSIPAQQPTLGDPVTDKVQNYSQKPYRRRSVCCSSSASLSQPSAKNQPRLSMCETSTSSIPTQCAKKEEDEHYQDTSSDESSSTTSSVNSSNCNCSNSTVEGVKEEVNQVADMLSVENFSNSSSSSLTVPTGEAPVLPARSSRRTSRLLTSIPQKKPTNDEQPMLPHAAPHQVYLSSEEDASSSADDFSDFGEELESECEKSPKVTERRISREDTARMVAVVFHGKPSMITLPRRSISPSSSGVQQSGHGILRTVTEPALNRPRSVSSTSSTSTFKHPPRSSSMMTAGLEKKRPGFLHIDPYAKYSDDHHESTRTPKTPTGMLRKTLSLVKKRSKQNLQQSESHITPMEQVGEAEEEDDPRESLCLEPPTPTPSVNYQDIIRGAKRNASISVPRSEVSSPKSPKNRFRAGLSLGRQRSVRA
ncbi:hypothetical protein QQS21_004038 [Conoideocrella luteorostrata]|uniref:Uncharacterized protein n=1 Tax=Conoideocrella luteorostrata TaxID=1105319 RepID=A0AAJ0CS45_9HYPO|nr:hypothetical protein QQS21_004038 [Conoideocrella luteorostrata]